MIGRWVWVLALLCGLGGAALAQPPLDETWLRVEFRLADGTPITARPMLRLFLVDGATRTPARVRASFNADFSVFYPDIEPGTYEGEVGIQETGLTDGPKRITVQDGPNAFIWTLPPVTTLEGDFTVDAKRVVPTQAQLLLTRADQPEAVPAAVTLTKGRYRIHLFTGDFRLLVLTDLGYALTEVSATNKPRETLQRTLALTPGGRVSVQATNTRERPLPGTRITMARQLSKTLIVNLAYTYQGEARVETPMLPPGEWTLTATRAGYLETQETITVTAGRTLTLDVALLRAPQ